MKHEINCIHSKAIIHYLREHNPDGISGLLRNLDPEIDILSNPEGFLSNPNNWISCEVAAELYKRAREIMEDERVASKVAKFAIETTIFDYAQGIVGKSFWSTGMKLKNLCKINSKWNRNNRIELIHLTKGEALVKLHWDPRMNSTRDLCLANQGTYIYMPRFWGGKSLSLTENCCYFEGAPYCEYRLSWPTRNRLHKISSRFISRKTVFDESIQGRQADKEHLGLKCEEVNKLHWELNQRIKQLSAIQETGKAVLSVLNLDELPAVILNILSDVCNLHWVIIMLVNQKNGHLEYLCGEGFEGDTLETIMNYRIPLDRTSNILVRVVSLGRSEYVTKVNVSHRIEENILLTNKNAKSVYVVPLVSRERVMGVIAAGRIESQGFPKATRETLDIISLQIAIAIQNAELYRQLDKQKEELKRAQSLLSRAEKFSFLGNISARLAHEIKNPMTAIGTFIQMLPYKYEDDEFRTDFYSIAREETARVNNLITELLDLVKIRESHVQPHDLHGLIHRMLILVSPQSKAKKLKIHLDFDPAIRDVWMDSEKMKQVILNLLYNAVEFTPEGGRIELVTKKCPPNQEDRNICIEIRDTGVGIQQENLDKIFDPYFTTKHRSPIPNGTGLGLFIAHQNMEDLKGTIKVRSTLNEGTVFVLTLPEKPPILSSELISTVNHRDSISTNL